MKSKYSIPLSDVIKEFQLEEVYMPSDPKKIMVTSPEVSRPGLAFSGFVEIFEPFRIQIIGKAEHKYLSGLSDETRKERIDAFFAQKPVAVVITTNLHVYDEMLEAARQQATPLLRTDERTSAFMASIIASLNTSLAPRLTRHGVLVEVYGEGILILGDSGIGKSETAIELVKRGHRLIADDAVEIRKVSSKSLVGSAPDNIRHFIELRGIGIINISRIFGVGAVKLTEKIDLVINMEHWDANKVYDRMGLENEMTEILGLQIPSLTIPIKPGRNLAIIIEVAAMNNRQKKLGYNAAQDLLKKLGMQDDTNSNDDAVVDIF